MTAKELVELLNGKTENAITKSIEKLAKDNGLVIVYGSSDDRMEFNGAINDEGSCYDGGEVLFTKKGCLQNQDECEEAIRAGAGSDIVEYTIGGRTVKKNRQGLLEMRSYFLKLVKKEEGIGGIQSIYFSL